MQLKDTRFLIPIYLTNITIEIIKKTNSNKVVLESEFVIENILVKGFTIENIIEKQSNHIFKKANIIHKLGVNQSYRIKDIELISQHGCGIIE